MDKRFWGVLAIVVAILVGIFAFTNHKSSSGGNQNTGPTNHIEGKGASGVTLVEYGDYQCPGCGHYYPAVKQVESEFQDQIYFQFRNFPLYQMHQNAIAGARAAEAAAIQGKFWQMHDKLYDENDTYYPIVEQGGSYNTWINSSNPLSYFTTYAKELGLDVNKFKTDYNSSTVNDRIQADLKVGNSLNISETPTFFIDGKKISDPNSLADFEKVIENAIKQKTGKTVSPSPSPQPSPSPANQ